MFGDHCPLVVTPAQLHKLQAENNTTTQDLVVLDASWHMPNSPRKGGQEYLAGHIPSAKFLDIVQDRPLLSQWPLFSTLSYLP